MPKDLKIASSDCLLGSLSLGLNSCQATGRAHWEAARARPGDTLYMWHILITAIHPTVNP